MIVSLVLLKMFGEKHDRYCLRLQRVVLNKYRNLHPSKQQLYGQLSTISQSIQVRRTRHAENRYKTRGDFIRDISRRFLSHGHSYVGQPVSTYTHQLSTDSTRREPIKTNGRLERIEKEN